MFRLREVLLYGHLNVEHFAVNMVLFLIWHVDPVGSDYDVYWVFVVSSSPDLISKSFELSKNRLL